MLQLSVRGLRALHGDQAAPCVDQTEQKSAQESSEELVEVHGCSREDRIDRIALNTLQPVAFQPVVTLQMSDAGFVWGSAFHPSP